MSTEALVFDFTVVSVLGVTGFGTLVGNPESTSRARTILGCLVAADPKDWGSSSIRMSFMDLVPCCVWIWRRWHADGPRMRNMASWPDAPTLDGNNLGWFNGSLAGVSVLVSALSEGQILALYSASNFSSYSGAVVADGPAGYGTLTQQSDACPAGVATVSIAVGGVTTCLFPAYSSGTACPSIATGGTPVDRSDAGLPEYRRGRNCGIDCDTDDQVR